MASYGIWPLAKPPQEICEATRPVTPGGAAEGPPITPLQVGPTSSASTPAAAAAVSAAGSLYTVIHFAWYCRGVNTLPAAGTGTVSHSEAPGAGRCPTYQVTGTVETSPWWRCRIAV